MGNAESTVSKTIWAQGGKRVFDVVATGILSLALFPVVILAALLVKLTSPGPLLFTQDRAGKNGKIFRLRKFRTMRGGREPDPKELVPLDHPEITRIGRFLRRFKIDELPQLVNVLRGEMSLIGPRPTLPDQVAAYDEFRRQRLQVRPGITGLAQVYGSALTPWDERILYDIAYVRRCSLLMDLWIILRTKWVILAGEATATRSFSSTRYAKYVAPPEGYPISQSEHCGI